MDPTKLTQAAWFKSTRSSGNGQCVEIAFHEGHVLVRDSKNQGGPALEFTPAEWSAFIAGAKDCEFDID